MKFHQVYYSLFMLITVGAGTANSVNVSAQEEMKLYPGKTDVYLSTGSRLPPVKREELDDLGKKLYDSYLAEGSSITLNVEKKEYLGPRGLRVNSPPVASYMSSNNDYLRYKAGIDPKLRELTILLAAGGMDNAYEWTGHEKTAIKEGLPQETIDIVKYDKPVPADLEEKEAAIINLAREVLNNHKVEPATFARALKLFGKRQLVDISALLGHYTATAILLTTFDQQLPPGKEPLLSR